ncbi:hypothetical protein OSB04_019099, partial [Centaurea solstitialis]
MAKPTAFNQILLQTAMSSSFRRSASSIHRQIRSISVPPSSFLATSIATTTTTNSDYRNPSLLKWISAAVAAAGIGASVCWYSGSSELYTVKSAVSFADRLMETVDRIRKSYEGQSLSSSNFFIRDTLRRRIFFNYEKRLRMLSPPEKVFEYFASVTNARGETLMTPADLMRAIVPVFPPSESGLVRDGCLRGERLPGELHCAPSEFFMLFDLNNDGLISFKEYIFFVTLLSIPESSFSVAFKMFDVDNDGGSPKGWTPNGLKVKGHVENGGLVHYFFGEDGNKGLRLDKFVQFLRDLHHEMIWLEFSHYDFKSSGTISAKDFMMSMVASGDIRHLNRLLDRVDELDDEPHLKEIRVTFEEFKNFAQLRKKLQPFSLALFSYGEVNGFLTRKDFQRAASQVCDVELSDNVIELIFHLFDANQDGNLCSDEFLRTRKRDKSTDRLGNHEAVLTKAPYTK